MRHECPCIECRHFKSCTEKQKAKCTEYQRWLSANTYNATHN